MQFNDPDLYGQLVKLNDAELDALSFGVVGMDPDGNVLQYNQAEARLAGLSKERVVGCNFFDEVAPCTNNYMVAGRFDDEPQLDETLNYVFTLKMKPTKVVLRMLKSPGLDRQYLLVRLHGVEHG